MQDDYRQPLRVAALFDIDPVTVADIHQPLIEGLDLRIKMCDCALMTSDPIHAATI